MVMKQMADRLFPASRRLYAAVFSPSSAAELGSGQWLEELAQMGRFLQGAGGQSLVPQTVLLARVSMTPEQMGPLHAAVEAACLAEVQQVQPPAAKRQRREVQQDSLIVMCSV